MKATHYDRTGGVPKADFELELGDPLPSTKKLGIDHAVQARKHARKAIVFAIVAIMFALLSMGVNIWMHFHPYP